MGGLTRHEWDWRVSGFQFFFFPRKVWDTLSNGFLQQSTR